MRDLREFQRIKDWPSNIKYQSSGTNISQLKIYKPLGGEEYGNELNFTDLNNCKVIRVSTHTTRYTLARLIINKDRPA